MKKILTKKYLIWAGIAVFVLVSGFLAFKNGNGKQRVTVTRANITQEVAATGKVKANQSVDLGFDKSGRVGGVYAILGQEVRGGDIIASLENGEIAANLAKARASLEEEKINLREVGNTAPVSYNDAYKNLDAAIKESFASADNAVRNRADQFFKTPTTNPRFEISIVSGNFVHYFNVQTDLQLELNSKRGEIELVLVNWQKRLTGINAPNISAEADKAISDLNKISVFFDKMASAVNTFSPSDFDYETTVSNYKSSISSARSEVSNAISSVVTAKDKLTTAPAIAENGQFESVLIKEAKVRQAEAAVSSLEASLAGTAIRAPFDGVITLQDAKVGETVSAGEVLVSIKSLNDVYVEANISEINIGKVKIGDSVFITLDAFSNEIFNGWVSFVEPGDVLVDGVVNYKIRVYFGTTEIAKNGQEIWRYDNIDSKIKTGLTANLKIKTAQKENVLVLPLYAINKDGDKSFVNMLAPGQLQRTEVELGLSGSNGMVEIKSGLKEGDTVEF